MAVDRSATRRTVSRCYDDEAAAVREGYRHLLDGGSLKSIARRWNEQGQPRPQAIPGTHCRPQCAPETRATREAHVPRSGSRSRRWSPLVEEETFELARALLSSPSRRTTSGTARKHLLPGIALCGICEGTMATGHTRHGKRVYVCRDGKHISRAADPVDRMVQEAVVATVSRPDARNLLGARPPPTWRLTEPRHEPSTSASTTSPRDSRRGTSPCPPYAAPASGSGVSWPK